MVQLHSAQPVEAVSTAAEYVFSVHLSHAVVFCDLNHEWEPDSAVRIDPASYGDGGHRLTRGFQPQEGGQRGERVHGALGGPFERPSVGREVDQPCTGRLCGGAEPRVAARGFSAARVQRRQRPSLRHDRELGWGNQLEAAAGEHGHEQKAVPARVPPQLRAPQQPPEQLRRHLHRRWSGDRGLVQRQRVLAGHTAPQHGLGAGFGSLCGAGDQDPNERREIDHQDVVFDQARQHGDRAHFRRAGVLLLGVRDCCLGLRGGQGGARKRVHLGRREARVRGRNVRAQVLHVHAHLHQLHPHRARGAARLGEAAAKRDDDAGLGLLPRD
mmetsp:Transcript_39680/g.73107  ORF Transcript_39680/g.73107 Transcript_39680/m.73107 type:complete len:327 (-) Transcript_39680:113-1093(-)